MRDLILMAAISVAALIGFRRPSLGALTFVFLGFFSPQSYTWGFARTFPFSQVIAVSTILGLFVSSERKALPLQRETILLVLLWGFFGISTFGALYPEEALERYIHVSKIFLLIVIVVMVINSQDKLYSLIRVIGFSLGFYALKGGTFALLSGGGHTVYGPETSFLYANNSIGLALAMNIPVLIYLLRTEQSSQVRWIIRAMLFTSYPAIVCTYSRGAWLGMVVATVVSLLKSRKRFLIIGLGGIIAVVLQTIVPHITPDRLVQRYDALVNYETEDSAQSRFWNWEFCKRVGFARPLIGGGFNYYTIESYAAFYPEFQERWPGKVWSCHSSWLTVFGEHGIPGFLIWLSLVISCMMTLANIRRYARRIPEESHLTDFVEMVKGSLVTYFVIGTFIDAAYFDLLYYFIALTVIQKRVMTSAVTNIDRSPDPLRIGLTSNAYSTAGA